LLKKVQIWWLKYGPLGNFFFQEETIFFYFTTLIRLLMAGLKIEFSNNFFDRVSLPPTGASFGQKLHPLGNFFFSEGNQKKLFYNFKSATDGGLKNVILEKKI
jgi:hypothetical protein